MMGVSWAILGHFAGPLGAKRVLNSASNCVFDVFCCWSSGALLGPILVLVGALLGLLGGSWAMVGISWATLGHVAGPLGARIRC